MRSDIVVKVIGWTLIAVTVIALALVGWSIVESIEGHEFIEYLPRLVEGTGLTLFLAGTTYVFGFLLGLLLLFLGLISKIATHFISIYQMIIRSTPMLAQLYLVYYGAGSIAPLLRDLGVWWLFKDPVACVLIVFLINTTAYQSYILIGSVNTVAKAQKEAGMALGLTHFPLIMVILLPQALRVAIKPLGNELVGMIKASSVASVVTVYDLLGTTQSIYNETFNLAYLPLAAFVYIILVEGVRIGTDLISKRFDLPNSQFNQR